MSAYDAVSEAVKFLQSHPNTRPILLSLFGCVVAQKVIMYCWRWYSTLAKIKGRQVEAEERKNKIGSQNFDAVSAEAILKKTTSEIVSSLQNRSLKAVEVLHAFQYEAMRVNKSTNCVTEPIMEAESHAQALDDSSVPKGLLHGMPISVKESYAIKGYNVNAGMEIFLGIIEKEDSVLVKVLKHHGAVPYVRTNIPQTMLSFHAVNPIYGETVNPHDHTRSPGGSSSGEGALVGGGGSYMGVGSDIGGSLRIPAAFCGIYTLKPTAGRISYKGQLSMQRGNLAIQPTGGPMTKDFESLVLLSKVLMSPKMYELDPAIPRMPFNNEEFEKTGPLKIGFYTYCGDLQCQPPVVRAVLKAKSALEAMGHKVVPFNVEAGFGHPKRYIKTLVADRGEKMRRHMKSDKRERAVSLYMLLGSIPRPILRAIAFCIKLKDPFFGSVAEGCAGFSSIYDVQKNIEELKEWQEEFMNHWLEEGLDAVICPVFPSPAPTREAIPMATACGLYCFMYNCLNYPSGVLPVTKVTDEDLEKTFDPTHYSPKHFLERLLLKSSKGSKDMPVGVQCVTLPYTEELCLRVMRDLEHGLKKV